MAFDWFITATCWPDETSLTGTVETAVEGDLTWEVMAGLTTMAAGTAPTIEKAMYLVEELMAMRLQFASIDPKG